MTVDKSKLKLIMRSTGIKAHPDQIKGDLIIDCRIINEGHEVRMNLLSANGEQGSFQGWVAEHNIDELDTIMWVLNHGLDRLPTRRGDKLYDKPFEILFFCAHGIHRSVATKYLMAKEMIAQGWKVEVI